MKPKVNIGSLLRQWLAGETDRKAERQLSQQAMDDPFLAEALEGFQQFPESNHPRAIQQLKTRLRQRTGKKKRLISYTWPRIAAAIALLLIAGATWWWTNSLQPEADMALKEETAPVIENQSDSSQEDAKLNLPQDGTATETLPQAKPAEPSKQPEKKTLPAPPGPPSIAKKEKLAEVREAKPERTEEAPTETSFADVPPAAQEKQTIAENTGRRDEAKEIAEVLDFDLEAEEEIGTTIATIEKDSAPPPSSEKRLIIGVVKGIDGSPLIGANVSVKGTRQSTITDYDGRFSLEIDECMNNVVADYTGFKSQTLDVSSADNVEFLLEEGMVLDEVTVTGFEKARAKKTDATANRVSESAAPKSGFKKFERYIRKNLRYPKAAKANNISGQVRLQFTVNQDGSLSDIIILQSLGYGCDAEAIRLLQEGPKWEINSFDGSVITSYVITFEK